MEVNLERYSYILFKPFNKIYQVLNLKKGSGNSNIPDPIHFLTSLQIDIVKNDLDRYSFDDIPFRVLDSSKDQFTLYLKTKFYPLIYFSSKYNKEIKNAYFEIESIINCSKRLFSNTRSYITEQINLIQAKDSKHTLLNGTFDNIFESSSKYIPSLNERLVLNKTNYRNEVKNTDEIFDNIRYNEDMPREYLFDFLYEVNKNIFDDLNDVRNHLGIEFYTSNNDFLNLFSYSNLKSNKYGLFSNKPSKNYKKFKIKKKNKIFNFKDENYFEIIKEGKRLKNLIIENGFN